MILEITNENYEGDISYKWEDNICIINHNMDGPVICQIYDFENRLVILDIEIIDNNNLKLIFPYNHIPVKDKSYSLIIISGKGKGNIQSPASDSDWEFEYYAGEVSDVMLFCKSLNIGNGKLCKINDEMVKKYMMLVNESIDSYLIDYYFVPVRRYNQVQPDGSIKKVFPGKIRLTALQWTAGLLLQSEFQNLEPNVSESAMKYIEDSRKEIYQMTLFNVRIPGLRWKSPMSRTMLPAMEPHHPIERFE